MVNETGHCWNLSFSEGGYQSSPKNIPFSFHFLWDCTNGTNCGFVERNAFHHTSRGRCVGG